MTPWYRVTNLEDVPSPSLLLYPDRIQENIDRMIKMAGGTARLRPHLKTHKLAELVRMQLAAGIDKFKCATIAEAEMAAGAGAPDVLLAYPVVGPNAARYLHLTQRFPGTRFSCLADNASAVIALAEASDCRLPSIGPLYLSSVRSDSWSLRRSGSGLCNTLV